MRVERERERAIGGCDARRARESHRDRNQGQSALGETSRRLKVFNATEAEKAVKLNAYTSSQLVE